jgi:hypothetical protein
VDIKNLTEEVNENVTDYLELGYKYSDEKNFAQAEKYFLIGFNKVSKSEIVDYLDYVLALSKLYYDNGKYMESLKYSAIGLEVYPYFKEFMYYKYNSLGKQNRLAEFDQIVKTANEIRKHSSDSLIISCLENFSEKNKINYYAIEKYLIWKQDPFSSLIKAIRFKNYIPFYSEYGGEFYFNEKFADPFNTIAIGCIQEVYNEKPEHAASLLKQLDLSNSSSEVKFSVAWYTMLSADFTNAQKQWDEIVLNSFWRISDCANYSASIPYECDVCQVKLQYKNKQLVKISDIKKDTYRGGINWKFDSSRAMLLGDRYLEEWYINDKGDTTGYKGKFLSKNEKDTIKLKQPFWYYEDVDELGFVTTNPIEAYMFKVNTKYPINAIIDCIKSSGCINWETISESNKMAIINWGHSHLLSGEDDIALKIYQLFPSDFEFGKDYKHLKYMQVLLNDWSDFEKLGLISKNKIPELKQKLASSNKSK